MFKKLFGSLDKVLLVILVLAYFGVMSYLSIRRHNAFFSSYDLANMDQVMWNTIKGGNFFQLSGADGLVSRFEYHADLILVLLSPIYLIWDDVRALLSIQSLFIGLGAVPIYLIAKFVLEKKWMALVIAGVYLINPGVMWTNMYDFHGESMAMFLVLMTLYLGLIKNWKWMFLTAILAMLTKENVPLVISAIGLFLMLGYREWQKGLMLILAGGIWFGVMVFGLMPYFSGGKEHWVWGWYEGSTDVKNRGLNLESIVYLIKKYTWNFTNSESVAYYKDLLKPWGFLPLLGLPWLLMTAPQLAINLLSSQGQMKSMVMHYDSMVVPGLVLGVIYGLFFVKLILEKLKIKSGIFLWGLLAVMVVMAVKQNYYYSPLPTTPSHWWPMYEVTEAEINFEKELKKIPPTASITASSEVRNHLTHRVMATNLPHGVGEVDYIAMVDHNRLMGDVEFKPFESELIRKISQGEEERYEFVYNQGQYWLFRKISR